MADNENGEQDDVSFLRTEDLVCLSCTATGERVCLSAEGFGNRQCFLEGITDKNIPPDLSQCVFMIEQALSVRALQELVMSSTDGENSGMGSGHKTLLYGNAILLRHTNSNMYLACLSSSSSNDKLAFDVGLQEQTEGEACWWTVHPSSKQRSEGEKVRVGDDAILVSVATERYLQATTECEKAIVNASFHVTHWSVAPFGTGLSRFKNVSCVFGGDVVRFYHAGDECLTIPGNWSRHNPETNILVYEGGNVLTQARSLWRLELARTKWSGGYINWYHPIRIRHITSGMYLGINENNDLLLLERQDATISNSCFYLRDHKDDNKVILEDKDLEVIGTPSINYDDTTVIMQHIETGLWVSYKSYQVKKKGVGLVEQKQIILHEEGKMDDGLEFSRSQDEEARTAGVIKKCTEIFNMFNSGLDNMTSTHRHTGFLEIVSLAEIIGVLEDLITYFAQPEEDISHEEKQRFLKALRNRQDLFQEEGILNLILEAIDKMNIITGEGLLSTLADEETVQQWNDISGYLFQLLAAIIRGNHTNCSQFAQAQRLNWLFSKLGSQAGGEGAGMMDVLYCILNDSPEALNMMKEGHIQVIISLLEKFGRDPKVLDILCNLCVGSGVAVRSSQNNIVDFLLPGKNLLLHTAVIDYVSSVRPNIFVGSVANSAIYSKWYFEVTIDHIESVSDQSPHFRVGWANTKGYVPYPGGGEKWGGNGVGDDLYSFGFDGAYLWTGGKSNRVVPNASEPYVKKGDNIGIAMDLSVPIITFFLNGMKIPAYFRNFNLDGMFFPVISSSAKISYRFLFGGDQGRLRFSPPGDFSPLYEGLYPDQILKIDPCFYIGDLGKSIISGSIPISDTNIFVPSPVDTSPVQLPTFVDNIKEKLAENIHEMWATLKIESGWTYSECRNDELMQHPCLTQFQNLPNSEKLYNIQLALQTLKTIVALGYTIAMDKPPSRIRPLRLPNDPYSQSNGYKPSPLDLSSIELNAKMEELVDKLSENTHNVWARERISQGWTYGLNEDSEKLKSPHLVKYENVDESIKLANRGTANEIVRTLMVYGYTLDPPATEQTDSVSETEEKPSRTVRLEHVYGVSSGKWYYECEILTDGPIKVGWMSSTAHPDCELGGDESSWCYDGYLAEKSHGDVSDNFGKSWQVSDVVGVFLDLTDKTICFSLNGELLVDPVAGEVAFSDVLSDNFVPAITLSVGQKCRINLGHDVDTFKYFTSCGLQEGYEPFCVNMSRPVSFWYTKSLPIFKNNEELPLSKISVSRHPAGADNPPSLKISHNKFEQEEHADWEFLRLSLPVTCHEEFIRVSPPTYNKKMALKKNDISEEMLDSMNVYFYGIRIFPGQDPQSVYVGWVTTQYHIHSLNFTEDMVRTVTIQQIDNFGGIQESIDRQSCYMVRANELYNEVSNDSSGKAPSQGLFIGCFIDTSTGVISFTCEGKETKRRFYLEPGTKLFPSAFFKASSKDALQFELGRTSNTLPLSSAILMTSGKHINPQFPPRLKVQCLVPHQWARAPNKNLQVHALKLSEVRGWSCLSEDSIQMIALHIPEEDRCIDILELIEHEKLLSFHTQTLKLYSALCYQSNFRAQHAICHYCDEKQLLYAIQSEYMPGTLRRAFFNTLISLHLESYAKTVEITQNEFIIPMGNELRQLYGNHPEMGNSLKSLVYVSIRPQMETCPITSNIDNVKELLTPEFPLELVREIVMDALAHAIETNQCHNRDPIGGSNQDLFVPLIKILDKLLMVGALSDKDIEKLLIIIHPQTWDMNFSQEGKFERKGLLDMKIHEDVKLELCYLLHHMCDVQVRHRIEHATAFGQDYLKDVQIDQLRRYIEIKQSDMPSAVAAKKTKEFRCPPREQMNTILGFKNLEEEDLEDHACIPDLREKMMSFHGTLMKLISISSLEEEEVDDKNLKTENNGILSTIMKVIKNQNLKTDENIVEPYFKSPEEKFRKVLVETIIKWGAESEIESTELVREMFSLLIRQYDTVGELMRGLENAYIVDAKTSVDVIQMWVTLSRIRSLLPVQMSKEEEELVRELLWTLVNNHVFFQHPDLMNILRIHENVIAIMMNSIARASQGDSSDSVGEQTATNSHEQESSHEMVVACCRFLCYFCRTSRQNQKAMFDHLIFILEHANILLSRPSLRGSTPLDVAYSSLMDNTELALALREHHLEKIAFFLSRCGLTLNSELISKGYPDLGWDPVEGERYLDFLRFCVWVGGESVEENANLVIRLLIRRPECLGPALRGEGEGLLKAIESGNKLSNQVSEQIETGKQVLSYIHPMPSCEGDEDFIDTGSAILSFYCTLVDLLGRCAPEASVIAQGKNDSLRARAILRSLVPLEDLQGVLSLPFSVKVEEVPSQNSDMPPGLIPSHKQSMALFLERVYGIEDMELFYTLLEEAFLPDLRAATMLERSEGVESDMGLALNRYIGNSILPILIKYNRYYSDADNYIPLLEATLHTVYRLSKGKMLTNVQRQAVSDFLVTLTKEIPPIMLLKLLRQLTIDLSNLNEYSNVALRMLTLFYERCSKYYGSVGGQGAYGCASDEEKKLTMTLFSSIFDSLSRMEYDPELFSKALPCLTAIGCALPPDYSKTANGIDDSFSKKPSSNSLGPYIPNPIEVSHIQLTDELNALVHKFSEHYHDAWAQKKQESGWVYAQNTVREEKKHNRLKPYSMLDYYEKETYQGPVVDALKALIALNWHIESTDDFNSSLTSRQNTQSSGGNPQNYRPNPADMTNLTLSKEMMNLAERLSEDAHDNQVAKMRSKAQGTLNLFLVPYDLLTEKEKRKTRERCQELLKYVQYQGYNIYHETSTAHEKGMKEKSQDDRFATNLLDKLIMYLDASSANMKLLRPSENFTRRNSFKKPNKTVKFFSKVVLPLIEKYFIQHRSYFTSVPTASSVSAGVASVKEKQLVASIFCKLANLIRIRQSAFGSDSRQAVKCLQVLIKAVDAKTLAKLRPEFVRTSMLLFFNNCAEDLERTISNLNEGKYPYLRGTHLKTCTSLKFIFEILIPILISTFDHISLNEYSHDLVIDEIQVACYKIIESLYIIGTNMGLTRSRKFIRTEVQSNRSLIGTCLAAISSTFPVAFLEPALNKNNPWSVCGSGFAERSLEAQEVTARLEQSIPTLDMLIGEVEKFLNEGGNYVEHPYIIEVILPFLCSYLPTWWMEGPDNVDPKGGVHVTMVTSSHMNQLLKLVLKLIMMNMGNEGAEWMTNIAVYAQKIIINTSEELLQDPFLPLTEKCRKRIEAMFHKEESCKQYLKAAADDASQIEGDIQEDWNLISRDVYSFFPLLIKYVDLQKTHWIRNNVEEAEQLYNHVGEIFNIMSASNYFRKEEQNFVLANEIDILALIMPSGGARSRPSESTLGSGGMGGGKSLKKKKAKKGGAEKEKSKDISSSLIVAALKRLLPVGLNLFAGKEQELVQHCKDKFLQKYDDEDINTFVKTQLTIPKVYDPLDELQWQHHLYSTLGNKKSTSTTEMKPEELEMLIQRIVAMGKVLYGLHTIDHPASEGGKGNYPKIVSIQRKRAVIACFRQISLHSLPRHAAVNLFLRTYKELWLSDENNGQEVIIDHLTQTFEDSEANKGDEEEKDESKADQISQLIHTFSQGAIVERSGEQPEDELFMSYADIMARSCGEEEEEGGDDEEAPSLQEQEIEKMRLLFNQGRLASRGASEMVLNQIAACKGVDNGMIESTLNLGIAILRGGNIDVQTDMLNILKEKRDAAFFTSIAGLMNSCTVLNLDAFERNSKAEGLGVGPSGPAGEKNMHDAEFTTLLFRFLQLTSEGHNNDWQNYLRTQAGNTTTVNVVICTVDYLLRLQESMMDFYWYYSRKEIIDLAGKSNFFKAIGVASQVFNTLTEVIQGPCVGNQQTLAHSRLWDAVGGFFFLFAHMQEKLSKNSSQVDLLQELLNLQKDLIVMLLSMLEGNVLNGTIGKQMVDTLVESASNVELILQYFKLFLNIPAEDDLDLQDGVISPKDFKEKLESTKKYSAEDIEFLLLCCETNHEGNIEFSEFSEMFLEPSKEIGFNLAVLLTNLSEHMPNDPRLAKFLESAGTVLEFFAPFLGRIEIKTEDKIERVYFEIDENNIEQWEKPQIKESKRAFFYATITEGGDKEKLECFVDFCEDAIFEMQHAESLMKSDDVQRTKQDNKSITLPMEDEPRGIMEPLKENLRNFKLQFLFFISLFSPSSLSQFFAKLKSMTKGEIVYYLLSLSFWLLCGLGQIVITVITNILALLLKLMRGKEIEPEKREPPVPLVISLDSTSSKQKLADKQANAMAAVENITASKSAKNEVSALGPVNFGNYAKKIVSFLARNFFTMKFIALAIAFIINFMLLFYKVSLVEEEQSDEEEDILLGDEADEGGDPEEFVHVDEKFYYLEYLIRFLGLTHAFVSLCMLIAYYNLKVPLAIFKREKDVARRLEFDGLYLAEEPEDDDIKAYWDKLVISAKSFPALYWDKFVKKRVRQKYANQFEFDAISNILGMEKSSLQQEQEQTGVFNLIMSIDWRYQVWKAGVTVTDNPFLYQLWYFCFSILGNYNYFFFAAHLLDVAVGVAALRIILEAITHNGKQLILTVMLLTIIVYIYTVIAFNFFRKFYVSEEEEEVDQKCHDMLTCFVFHLYKGVRAGGGIGDEIEPPDGDDYEVYRILFDISFFFFIIVILLAIIQGFIIDAFGALRDQMQGVEDELENNCFICGIGKDYLDKVPHGFDIHVQQEHNLANYLFFLMYLINKDETEYTGQETYVWDMYQQRCWDFFPAGDCFRKQYEDELGATGGS